MFVNRCITAWRSPLLFGILCLILAICCSAETDLTFVEYPRNATAGKSYKVTWTGSTKDQALDVTLVRGDSYDFTRVEKIAVDQLGGGFAWTVDTAIQAGNDYVLELDQSGATNYTERFAITNDASSAINNTTSNTTATSSETSGSITSGSIASNDSSSSGSGSSLSMEAKAGIVVGVLFGSAILIGFAFFFGRRAARKASTSRMHELTGETDRELVGSSHVSELSNKERIELPTVADPVEKCGQKTYQLP